MHVAVTYIYYYRTKNTNKKYYHIMYRYPSTAAKLVAATYIFIYSRPVTWDICVVIPDVNSTGQQWLLLFWCSWRRRRSEMSASSTSSSNSTRRAWKLQEFVAHGAQVCLHWHESSLTFFITFFLQKTFLCADIWQVPTVLVTVRVDKLPIRQNQDLLQLLAKNKLPTGIWPKSESGATTTSK